MNVHVDRLVNGSWDAFVDDHPAASIYHRWVWRRVIEAAFGHQCFYLSAHRDDGRVVGVLPLALVKSWLFGRFLVSLPFFNYGGIVAEDEVAARALYDYAATLALALDAQYLELRHREHLLSAVPGKTHKVTMELALPDNPEVLWKSFPAKVRNQVRKAEKAELVPTIGRTELLSHFYDVFALNMRDLGTPVYSKRYFATMLNHWPESWITMVYRGQEPVAGAFLVGLKPRLEIPWASSRREFNKHCPNNLLYWTALKTGIEHGYRLFDFGRSTPDSGTFRFKKQWGAQPVQLHWQYWISEGGKLPDLSPANAKYQRRIAAWQRMPLSLTRWLGPHIVKSIP